MTHTFLKKYRSILSPVVITLFLLITTIGISLSHPRKAQADLACGAGSTCTGNTAYLKVGACVPNASGTSCLNAQLEYNKVHNCPTGGGPGSCTAIAEGKDGCNTLTPIDNGSGSDSSCECKGGPFGSTCSSDGEACGRNGDYSGTCECAVIGGVSCPAPASGPLGCCYTPATYCGDNICNGGETCSTCSQDCGVCGGPTPPPTPIPAYCGDGTCNDTEGETQQNCAIDCGNPGDPDPFCGDGACNALETCSTCSQDCGTCSTPDFCGDGTCSATESCSTCSQDCGTCSDPGFCGDSVCSAFETCDSCPADCGGCPTDIPWWQARGGNIYSASTVSPAIRSLIPGTTCTEPTCTPQLLAQIAGLFNADTDGVIITGGGNVQSDGYYGPRDLVALGSQLSRYKEGYDFFYRKSDLGLNPSDSFTGQYTNALKPITDGVHYSGQDLTIEEPWDITAGESYIIFVDGNLDIMDPSASLYPVQQA